MSELLDVIIIMMYREQNDWVGNDSNYSILRHETVLSVLRVFMEKRKEHVKTVTGNR
jgi:hypothetical protein